MGVRASTVNVRSDIKLSKTLLGPKLALDKLQIMELTNRCKYLKYRFRGVFSADFACSSLLKKDNFFMNMNTSPSD